MQLNFEMITVPLWLLWALGIGAFFIGGIIGYIDSNSRTAQKVEAAENKAELAIKEAERKIAAMQEKLQPDGSPVIMDEPGLLRIKNVNGAPSLEVDGVMLNVKNISPEKKKRLIELVTILRPWLESRPTPQPVTRPEAPASTPTASPAPVQAAVPAARPTSTQPIISPAKALEDKDFKLLSIVNQIDTVLQKNIEDTHLANKGIRLTESSAGGVEVYVGLNKYASIDDVLDPEIKKVIRAAIAEWEEKYTPKM